jgi:hypothetical protein
VYETGLTQPAVCMSNGNLVLTFHTITSPDNTDILLMASTDRGGTWPAPVSVCVASGKQRNPNVVSDGGELHVVWSDGRCEQQHSNRLHFFLLPLDDLPGIALVP